MKVFIRNVEDAKKFGPGLSLRQIRELIVNFDEFNPHHILPEEDAQKYLDENWEGRPLDVKHFNVGPRRRIVRKPEQPVLEQPPVPEQPESHEEV
jgi:hypothetical protein